MGSVAEKLANVVGVVTLGFGVALTVAPRRSGAALGMGDSLIPARAVGVADLVVGSGILYGRPRWPWMVSRAALNVVLAASYRAEARAGDPRARAGATAMSVLTVVDTTLAIALAAQRNSAGNR